MLFQEIPDDPPMHNIKHPRTSGLAMKQVLLVFSSTSTLIIIFFNFSKIQRGFNLRCTLFSIADLQQDYRNCEIREILFEHRW